ncbi:MULTISPECIES: FAD-dependent oxidoreductase [Sphingomonas]|uniref:3-phenylpropionate/trans-cinnamate dioxygenase ferredoxin reductase subunit n=2 Tax=Sphingomonadaceae TaxID=41297 RepID=A0A7X5XXI4_9SPHN|nr:3-phenylpropionate/trans-cinnamate dioxygenase ferredoxin reductase subunit [Sphingomonas trueperi]
MGRADAHVVILGAGHAGGTAAALLRQYGFEGAITLVGEESIPPYHRPPLSKASLRAASGAAPTLLKPTEFYETAGVRLRLGIRADKLERQSRTVTLSTGEDLQYDHLVIATGARPIRLRVAGSDLDGVLELRTAGDAERLKKALKAGQRLAIVGGGYIGLEVAASARALGADVTVIERELRLLARVACRELSTFFHDCHARQGVNFELGATVSGFEGQGGHITGVHLDDGRTIACDAALVGVGAVPNDEIARDAGLDTASGILVDLEARTSDPAIFAIGDVARRPIPLYAHVARLESVPNALEQAKQAVGAIVGRPAPVHEVPWQWSDQYDVKLQIAGQAIDVDRVLRRGGPSPESFAIFHLKGDRIQCVEAINSPQDFLVGKQFIGVRASIDPDKLSDAAIPLKEAVI